MVRKIQRDIGIKVKEPRSTRIIRALRAFEVIILVISILLIFISSIMTIVLTQDFGNLIHGELIKPSKDSLTGTYPDALIIMQSFIIALTCIYCILHIIRSLRETPAEFAQLDPEFEPFNGKKIGWFSFEKWVLLITLIAGLANSVLVIYLIQQFTTISTLVPTPLQENQNATLVGPYGAATFATSIVCLVLSTLSIFLKHREYLVVLYVIGEFCQASGGRKYY
jgi:hypothetical protein